MDPEFVAKQIDVVLSDIWSGLCKDGYAGK